MTTDNQGYQIVLSLLHEYTRTTTSPSIDGFSLWLLRRQAHELQQQREVIRQKILQEADERLQK